MKKTALTVVAVVALILIGSKLGTTTSLPLVGGGFSSYRATTTVSALQDPHLLKAGSGTLGSIIVGTPSGSGTYICYNATTTNINLREAKYSTSTIEIATLKAAPVGGTYNYDASFSVGLICDEGGSFDGVYTTTWK